MDAICCLKLLVPHCLLLLGNAPAAAIITTKSLLSHCNLASSLRPTLWTLRRRRGVALLFFIFVKSAVHMGFGGTFAHPGDKIVLSPGLEGLSVRRHVPNHIKTYRRGCKHQQKRFLCPLQRTMRQSSAKTGALHRKILLRKPGL